MTNHTYTLEGIDLHDAASYLYDGGWRSSDAVEMTEEYGITCEMAERICEYLAQFESKEDCE